MHYIIPELKAHLTSTSASLEIRQQPTTETDPKTDALDEILLELRLSFANERDSMLIDILDECAVAHFL